MGNFAIFGEPEGVSAPLSALTSTVGSAPCSAIQSHIRIQGILASGIFLAAHHFSESGKYMGLLQYAGARKSNCFFCECEFELSSERTLFCSNVCKQRYDKANSSRCFYCGNFADTRDHLIPHSVSGRNRRIWKLDWVSSCMECNRYMGAHSPYSMTDRVRLIIRKVTKKYRLSEPDPDWCENDLAEMSAMFRNKIVADAAVRRLAEGRVVMLKARLVDLIEVEITQLEQSGEDADGKNSQTPSSGAISQSGAQIGGL